MEEENKKEVKMKYGTCIAIVIAIELAILICLLVNISLKLNKFDVKDEVRIYQDNVNKITEVENTNN